MSEPGQLDITVGISADWATLHVRGELDLLTAPQLTAAVRELFARGGHVTVVDVELSGVTFCDSTGLGELLKSRNAAKERGAELRLSGISPRMRQLLEITSLAEVFGA